MKKKLPFNLSEVSTKERFNWGYWDGKAHGERGKRPEWDKPSIMMCKHPFDDSYGKGYWKGWYEGSSKV